MAIAWNRINVNARKDSPANIVKQVSKLNQNPLWRRIVKPQNKTFSSADVWLWVNTYQHYNKKTYKIVGVKSNTVLKVKKTHSGKFFHRRLLRNGIRLRELLFCSDNKKNLLRTIPCTYRTMQLLKSCWFQMSFKSFKSWKYELIYYSRTKVIELSFSVKTLNK